MFGSKHLQREFGVYTLDSESGLEYVFPGRFVGRETAGKIQGHPDWCVGSNVEGTRRGGAN